MSLYIRELQEKKKATMCDNAGMRPRQVISGGCYDSKQTHRVKITYNLSESDTLYLCEHCKDRIVDDAESRRYDVSVSKL